MGYGDGPNPHREEPLVKSLKDISALRHLYPLPRKNFVSDLNLFSGILGDQGIVEYLEASNAGAWGMESLGPDNMLMCAAENKPLLSGCLVSARTNTLEILRKYWRPARRTSRSVGSNAGPSVGWSPDNIKEFFSPLIRESVELVKKYGGTYRYQDDGKNGWIIPNLVELGVDIISGLQPPPVGDCVFGDIKAKWGKSSLFNGWIGPHLYL